MRVVVYLLASCYTSFSRSRFCRAFWHRLRHNHRYSSCMRCLPPCRVRTAAPGTMDRHDVLINCSFFIGWSCYCGTAGQKVWFPGCHGLEWHMSGVGGWLYSCCEVRSRSGKKERECLIWSSILRGYFGLGRTYEPVSCGILLGA